MKSFVNLKSISRSLYIGSACLLFMTSCKDKATDMVVAEPPVMEGESLFDGVSFDGWKEYNMDSIGDQWVIMDSALVAAPEGVDTNVGFGHSLITEKEYGNFELSLDYKITKGGNSGIIYHIIEDTAYSEDYWTGPEFQILDDEFATSESLPNRIGASAYDMYPASADKVLHPAGEWNSIKLVYQDGKVEHWLNGQMVLSFDEKSADWAEKFAASKFKDSKVWGKSPKGHIGLQNHGDAIWFKNIWIKEL